MKTVTVNEQQSGSFKTYLHNYIVWIQCRVGFFLVCHRYGACLFFPSKYMLFLKKKKNNCSHAWFMVHKKKVYMFGESRTQRHTRYLAKGFVIFVTH